MVQYRDKPCDKCGWRFKTTHICLDLPDAIMERIEDGRERDVNGQVKSTKKAIARTDEHKEGISDGLRRAAASDPRRIERNKEILKLYDEEEWSMADIATSLRCEKRTVMTVLQQAEDRGDITIRRRARRTGAH